MIPLPTQETTLYFLLSLIVALLSILLAILLKKNRKLDELQETFSKRELELNQKLYETSILKSKLETLVHSMTEGVFMLDKDLTLLVINPACRSLLGLSELGKITIFDVVRSFDKHYPIEETINQVFETGDIKRVSEVKVNDKFFQITVIPIEVAKGVPGVGVLLHDQTEEQNLRHKHEEFMAMIVHELRAPLTVIKGMADLIIRKKEQLTEEKRNELLSQLRDSSIELMSIVNEMLDDTKKDMTKFDVHLNENDLNSLLEEEVKNYENLTQEKNLFIKFEGDGKIPTFKFDEVKVLQVLNNLLSNAVKFTKEGGITVKSELSAGYAKVSVEDTGDGVDNDKKDQLFQKFVQLANSEKADGPGTGLGLVISKGIVEAHGGKIWIEDNEPKGARFVFTLPVE